MSVRPSACPYQRGPHWTDFRKIRYWGLLQKSTEKTPNLVKIWQKYRELYTKTYVRLYCSHQYEIFCISTTEQREPIVAFPWQHWTVSYCWQLHVVQQQYKCRSLLRFNSNNGCANAPQCYVIRTFSVMFKLWRKLYRTYRHNYALDS